MENNLNVSGLCVVTYATADDYRSTPSSILYEIKTLEDFYNKRDSLISNAKRKMKQGGMHKEEIDESIDEVVDDYFNHFFYSYNEFEIEDSCVETTGSYQNYQFFPDIKQTCLQIYSSGKEDKSFLDYVQKQIKVFRDNKSNEGVNDLIHYDIGTLTTVENFFKHCEKMIKKHQRLYNKHFKDKNSENYKPFGNFYYLDEQKFSLTLKPIKGENKQEYYLIF